MNEFEERMLAFQEAEKELAVTIVKEMLPKDGCDGVDIDSPAFLDICEEHERVFVGPKGKRMVRPDTMAYIEELLDTIGKRGFGCLNG